MTHAQSALYSIIRMPPRCRCAAGAWLPNWGRFSERQRTERAGGRGFGDGGERLDPLGLPAGHRDRVGHGLALLGEVGDRVFALARVDPVEAQRGRFGVRQCGLPVEDHQGVRRCLALGGRLGVLDAMAKPASASSRVTNSQSVSRYWVVIGRRGSGWVTSKRQLACG